MNKPDEQWWVSARQARDKLFTQVKSHAAVTLVDIGEDPNGKSLTPVLRVHVRQPDAPGLQIPDAIDNIPVRVIRGDYLLQ